MDITAAFDELQKVADADPADVREARRRRDLFRDAFASDAEGATVIPSGSLARSTQREPINDVDVIIVFESAEHPDWGQPGDSAAEALGYTGQRINELLGATNGAFAQEVRLAKPRNHAVKCFLDDPDDPDAFTVDAMPALRQADGTLLVPEKAAGGWISTHPECLIQLVADRQKEWDLFRPLVRVLKLWKDVRDTGLNSLTVEVLAIEHLPAESSRARALYRFFNAAEMAIDLPIQDPAGLCGDIQADLDVEKARAAISAAAKASWAAVSAQDQGDTDRAACLWRSIFGDAFPEPDGGCPAEGEEDSGFGPFAIGTGAGASSGVGITDPRPVIDAPQGLMHDWPRISWMKAEAHVLSREREAMAEHCPEMEWRDSLPWPRGRVGVGWEGLAPVWGGVRPQPAGVAELLNGRRLRLRVIYPEGFPMVPPDLYPLEPEVPIDRRTQTRWHVSGDGSLCTVQAAEDWQPDHTAADLVRKASGWYIEYLLVEVGELDAMTVRGVISDTSIDALLATYA